nr:putative disease resistance protein RGA1 [Quercus suber]
MAEIAYGIAGKVLEQLGSRTFQEISSAWGVRNYLKKLEHTVSAIEAVLYDAEERQASDQGLRTWLGELKDDLNDAENVLDEFQCRILQKEAMKRYGSTKKKENVRVCVEDFSITRLIKEILKSAIDKIDENFGVHGLQNNLRELLRDKKFIDNLGADELQFRLRELLKDNKFLFVLDDVWNEDRNKWMELQDLLLGGYNGSKIIVTTRNNSIATIMGTVPTYHLHGLSNEDCMSLFVKLAFKEREEKQYPNLLEIGNDIVKKCTGVPLAVRTLASLLYSKVDEREWKSVRDNEIWHLKQNEGDILLALRLSYNQLPFHLKQCFAYCSLFPKDYEFNSSLLVQFWMAHGLLQ